MGGRTAVASSSEIVAEHARRAVAQILLALSVGADDFKVLVILGELFSLGMRRRRRRGVITQSFGRSSGYEDTAGGRDSG